MNQVKILNWGKSLFSSHTNFFLVTQDISLFPGTPSLVNYIHLDPLNNCIQILMITG
jgi:hypothetical protein